MRPPGYEPGELPTAPLRDVSSNVKRLISDLRVQRYCFLETYANFLHVFSCFSEQKACKDIGKRQIRQKIHKYK